jgi:hypothetical protein
LRPPTPRGLVSVTARLADDRDTANNTPTFDDSHVRDTTTQTPVFEPPLDGPTTQNPVFEPPLDGPTTQTPVFRPRLDDAPSTRRLAASSTTDELAAVIEHPGQTARSLESAMTSRPAAKVGPSGSSMQPRDAAALGASTRGHPMSFEQCVDEIAGELDGVDFDRARVR